jgi:hypothetical protein
MKTKTMSIYDGYEIQDAAFRGIGLIGRTLQNRFVPAVNEAVKIRKQWNALHRWIAAKNRLAGFPEPKNSKPIPGIVKNLNLVVRERLTYAELQRLKEAL